MFKVQSFYKDTLIQIFRKNDHFYKVTFVPGHSIHNWLSKRTQSKGWTSNFPAGQPAAAPSPRGGTR